MKLAMQHHFFSSLTALGTILTAAAAGQTLGSRAVTFQGTTVVSSAPVEDIAEILQSRCGVAVTYEDPIWQWAGEFQNAPGQPYGLFRIQRTVNIPADLTPGQTSVLNAAAFGRALSEYNRTYDAPRYRVTESKLGLHVIPESVRDAGGNVIPANNPLDAKVQVPPAKRPASEHLQAVCAAASQVTQSLIQCGAVYSANQGNWWEEAFAAPGGAFEWGAGGETAREALIDLFTKLGTTFSWRLHCANPSTGDRACIMNVERVFVAKPDGKRGFTAVPLMYDRCPACAPPAQAR